MRLLVRIPEQMARGNAVTITPVQAELRTQKAAEMLKFSRPSLIRLLDSGRIEYRRAGTHRRVRFESLLEYIRQADEARYAGPDELAEYDQQLGI